MCYICTHCNQCGLYSTIVEIVCARCGTVFPVGVLECTNCGCKEQRTIEIPQVLTPDRSREN